MYNKGRKTQKMPILTYIKKQLVTLILVTCSLCHKYTLYKSMRTLSSDSWACLEQRCLKDFIASIASPALSSRFITTAMSLRALSTLSPAFIAFQNQTIAASESFSTSFICMEKKCF
uniref:Uncharacterized protein MANES_03G149600 n=1 Tax=Rhizophora mucronata TaxID=61149 RepID=A0A2P2K0X6_RHIMU